MLKMQWTAWRLVGSLALGLLLTPVESGAADSPVEDSTELFNRQDRNADGYLSAQEVGGYGWMLYDKDRDGYVSKDEFLGGRIADKWTAANTPDSTVAWNLLDWNHDGWLSGTELDGKYHRYDANGDNRVVKEEFVAGWQADRKANPPKPRDDAPAVTWVDVVVRDKGFSFKMPGQPKIDENGFYTLTTDNDNTVYMVTFHQGEADLEASAEPRLTAIRDEFVARTKGKVTAEKRAKHDGRPGAEFEIEGADKIEYAVSATIAGRWICQMVVIASLDSKITPGLAGGFLDSLRVTAKDAPSPAPQPTADGWKLVDAGQHGFTIQMPGEPNVNPVGDYIYASEDKQTAFIVNIRAGDENLEATAAERLQATKRAAEELTKGTLQNEKAISLDGHPGLAYAYLKSDETEYRYRVYIVGNRLCQLAVIRSSESQTSPAAVNRFFDSVKIVAERPVPTPPRPVSPSENTDGWVVTTLELGVSFAMPAQPERDGDGVFVVEADQGSTIYKVILGDEAAAAPGDAAKALDAVRDTEAKNLQGAVSGERDFEQSGYKGREFTVTTPGDAEVEVRYHVLLAGKRVIELAVVRTANSQTSPANIRRFFNSLKVLGPVPAPPQP